MTRSELIKRLAEKRLDLQESLVEAAVKTMLDHMAETLVTGGRIEIRGFGSFSTRAHPDRQGRNPKTGESVYIPSRRSTHFKPGNELKQRVNES